MQPGNRFVVMAAQDMREDMLGVGSCWCALFVLLCATLGSVHPKPSAQGTVRDPSTMVSQSMA